MSGLWLIPLLLAQAPEPTDAGEPPVVEAESEEEGAGKATEPESEREADGEQSPPAVENADDQILIIDAEPAETETLLIIDAGETDSTLVIDEPPPSVSIAAPTSRTWMQAEIASRLMLDTAHEATGEDVVEWWNVGTLRLDYKRGRALRAVAEGRVRWGVAGEDPAPEHPMLIANVRDRKWTGDVELREGYLEVRPLGMTLRIGQRIYVWGKNEVFAAADVLNPSDLRFDPLALTDSPKQAKVPVFALDLSYGVGDWQAQLVALPFFTAHRAFLLGRDLALAPPGSALEAEIRAIGDLHPSIEDELQGAVAGTELPEESPWQSSVALRVSGTVASIDLAMTAYNGWDRTPRVRIDPDLAILFANADAILIDSQILVTNPVLRDASLGVQQKSLAGEQLIRARYRRMWRFAFEAQGVIDDFVVRADVGFSPRQTFYTADLEPRWLPSVTAAVGVEYMRGEEIYAALTGVGQAVPSAPAGIALLGIEATHGEPPERDTAMLYGLNATARYSPEDVDLEFEGTLLLTIEPGDRLGAASLAWDGFEPHIFKIGFMLFDGERGTTGHRFRRNDFLYLAYRSVW